ncbi:MAG TPA: type VI secretion system tip protein TssI/VgrG [Minicystis sp.]|nr:type VI secretion system tip protein TssI/VgrG [Minicystis sp.]
MADDGSLESVEIGFISGAMPDDDVRLLGVRGRERLSGLFEFDLLFTRSAHYSDAELDDLLKAPCAIALGPKPGDVVHGLLASVEVLDTTRTVAAVYVAKMVPKAWLMTLSKSSRIYQQTTVPDMVATVLKGYGLQEGKDFEVHNQNAAKSPTREYIVQYQESDWDFIQRWLEQEGFFYFFSHSKTGEKLVIADTNTPATPIDDPATLSYRERNNLSAGRRATIWNLRLHQKRIPARVSVQDYNYRTPSIALYVSAPVDQARGFGAVSHYGEHFKDLDVGKAVAQLRAERVLCERRTYRGETDCSRFRVGHSFQLENHYDGAYDGKYLITAIEHRVGDPVPTGLATDERSSDGPQRYTARFAAIPFDVAFRPERVTPWPRVRGVMHGHVDADTAGDYAMIDAQGRYRVRLPFDLVGGKGSGASRWIRMAQPYAGAGYGTHHPLHKGTEVLVAYIDGDPDRPIIVGSVPNPHTLSPSTSSNASQSVTQTASGIRIELEDLQR